MAWYGKIKEIAKKQKGVRVEDLLALSPGNDPFFVGRKSAVAGARWAGEWYERWKLKMGKRVLHVRRLHYFLVSLENVVRPTSPPTPYVNTDACWNYLVQAVKNARYLGLIPMAAIEDSKNERMRNTYYWGHQDVDDKIRRISAEAVAEAISEQFNLYNSQLEQPYHMEIWIEKAMNDILVPIVRRYGIDLVIGEGEISLTQVNLLMARAARIGKPVRVFYIADFDPKLYVQMVNSVR